jgi:8-oxo-dGTP pyrophosphatase MutT (NUDIX family)
MTDITPLPAATVTLVRDGARGLEVLLLQRNFESGFMPGVYLFPGGALDEEDESDEVASLCGGMDDARASAALGVPRGGLAYWTAAIRESFEEAGVLLAYDEQGGLVRLDAPAVRERFVAYRAEVNASGRTVAEMLRTERLTFAVDRLAYFSHWITPAGAPRRYDTRFFIAAAPENQDALHDNRETIHHVWIAPAEALERRRKGTFSMRLPTVCTLEEFAHYRSAGTLIAAMKARTEVRTMMPRINARGERVLPGDPTYEEAGEKRGAWKP